MRESGSLTTVNRAVWYRGGPASPAHAPTRPPRTAHRLLRVERVDHAAGDATPLGHLHAALQRPGPGEASFEDLV